MIFRTDFVTHEMIVLQYSYYMYGASYTDYTGAGTVAGSPAERVMPWPYGQYGTLNTSLLSGTNGTKGTPPDAHVISLWASMWW